MTINGSTYYFGSDSRMKTGLISTNGTKYYFGTNGVMVKEQSVTVNGNLYYFNADGTMFTGEKTIDGVKYYFDAQDGIGRVWQEARILAYVRMIVGDVGKDVRSCYDWFVKNVSYQTLPIPYPVPDGYTELQTYALYCFDNHKGNCYCFSAGFYYVMKYLGYEVYFVKGKVRLNDGKYYDHGWVETVENGTRYIYDPELERERKQDLYRQLASHPGMSYIS
jgi:hypothetical protein